MRAAVCAQYGPPTVVRIEDLPSPRVGPGQVKVLVAVAAVNFPDVLLIADQYQVSVPTPFTPGSEFAGAVTAVGDGVAGVRIGDRVTGTAIAGAFAEEVVIDSVAVRPIADEIAIEEAAAAGVTYRTAYHVMRSVAALAPGEKLVVLGAGGGVGSAAVQIGAHLGAEVTAVASSADKLSVASRCGAEHLIDHSSVDLREALRSLHPDGVDVVIDPVGGALAEPALRSLHWGGRFVTVGYASGEIPRIALNLVLLKGIRIEGFQFIDFATNAADELIRNESELDELLQAGLLRPQIGSTFTLDETATALSLVSEGKAIGKVLIDMTGGTDSL